LILSRSPTAWFHHPDHLLERRARFDAMSYPHNGDDSGDENYAKGSYRSNSWLADAMLQQSGSTAEDLEQFFGASGDVNDPYGFDDDEVLEQYRIMAQHEAISRVKENTGFDMVEYNKKKKMQGEDSMTQKGLFGDGKKSKTRLPEPKLIVSGKISAPKPEEPPLPLPKLRTRFMSQKLDRVPGICPGVSMRVTPTTLASMPPDEHIVRCVNCRSQLRVKILASLVSCSECSTVSSASSTRH